MAIIKCIMCVDAMDGYAKDNNIPWDKPDDMQRFKRKTMGTVFFKNAVVMGNKTFKSMGSKPLTNRMNYVFTNTPKRSNIKNLKFIDSMYAIDYDKFNDVWIIGGESILKLFKPIMDEFHLTRLQEIYDCDTFLDVDYYIEDMELMDTRTSYNSFDIVYDIYRRVRKKEDLPTYTIIRIDGKEKPYANFNCDDFFTLSKILKRIDKKGKKYKIMTLQEAKEYMFNNV